MKDRDGHRLEPRRQQGSDSLLFTNNTPYIMIDVTLIDHDCELHSTAEDLRLITDPLVPPEIQVVGLLDQR